MLELGIGVHDPERVNEWLPTYHGFRKDIGFDARSMWEANLARLLMHLGFYIEPHTIVSLNVGDGERELFKGDTTDFIVDFKAVSPKGKEYWYNILASPRGQLRSEAKVSMFRDQYPERKIIIITERKYYALKNAFAEAVNRDKNLIGWETIDDNLTTNPEKYL